MNSMQDLILNLQRSLFEINKQNSCKIIAAEHSIKKCVQVLEQVKSEAISANFKPIEEEINFFKNVKPQLISTLIFHHEVYKIETQKPQGGQKILKKYLLSELKKINDFYKQNADLYKYFRSNSTYLDNEYFVRGRNIVLPNIDTFFYDSDQRFSTLQDYKLAKILSNQKVQDYLENELRLIKNMTLNHNQVNHSQVNHKSPIYWSGSKTALIELMYALHTTNCINDGKAELKQIADFIEQSFHISLGQFNRVFLEIRARKMGRTKFLDSLKEELIKRMDIADDAQ
jgi:hypothetical protein